MLRTLEMLCILLKVFMLTITATAVFSTDQEDRIVQDTLVFKLIDAHAYYMLSNLSIESVENYSDSEIVRNEVALQEGTTSSPENIPSEPTFSRAFVEFGNRLNKSDIFVTFRWKQPEFTNGKIQKYRVQYWFIDSLKRIQTSVDISPAKILQHKVYDLKPDTMYYFKVQAHNKVGAGPYTKFINVSTTHENSVPLLLVKSWNRMHVLDIDLQIVIDKYINGYKEVYRKYYSGYITYSALEHKIYWFTSEPIRSMFRSMLMTCNFNPNINEIASNCTTITTFVYDAEGPCIDWVARNLYWIQYNDEDNISNFLKLDLTLWQMDIFKSDNILKINGRSKFLIVLPSIGYLYWTQRTSENQLVTMQSDYEGKNITPFLKNKDNICFCPYKILEPSSCIHIDNTNIDKPLIYWTLKDRLIAADIDGSQQTHFYNHVITVT